MKNKFLFLIIVIFNIHLSKNVNAQFIRQGRVGVFHSESMYNTGLPIEKFKLWPNTIWFNDSIVIYELRTHYSSEDYGKDSVIVQTSYPVERYTYLNLQTMSAQDYAFFSDTAKPLSNFVITDNDKRGFWKFYNKPEIKDTAGMIAVPDTSVEGILYKRMKKEFIARNGQESYFIYYLAPDHPQTIFHLNPAMDCFFRGYAVTRADLYMGGEPISVFEYKILNTTLTKEERKIFKQWKKNASKTKLPVISSQEAFRIPVKIHHENPETKVIPRKD